MKFEKRISNKCNLARLGRVGTMKIIIKFVSKG